MFRYFKQRNALKLQSRALYNEAVMQSRLPVFYKDLCVPDSFDGRFELVVLHCYIIIHRLNKAGQVKLSQVLFDTFFISMDQSIRELGIGDVGVPKHMKRMMQGFNGRCQGYEIAVENDDLSVLNNALVRNVYGTLDGVPSDAVLESMRQYVKQSCTMDATDAEFAAINLHKEMEYG